MPEKRVFIFRLLCMCKSLIKNEKKTSIIILYTNIIMPEKHFKFKVGDIVKTFDCDHVGTISEVYKACPQSNHWLSIQEIPIRAESVRKPWYQIKCIPDGVIVVPEYDIELVKRTEEKRKNYKSY
jgi:hypothetical protein